MDPEAQMMAQALGGQPPSDVAQLQGSPGFPKNLSPEALVALFLVPGVQKGYTGPYRNQEYKTTPGESGRYDIMHDSGKRVGAAILEYRPDKKEVYVGHVQGGGPSPTPGSKAASFNEWAHSLGTKELRSLLRNVAETFPGAEKLTGDRISGALHGAQIEALEKIKNASGPGHGVVLPSSTQSVRLPRQPGFGAPGQRLTDLW